MKIAAMADLHRDEDTDSYKDVFSEISEQAEVLLLCGDLTDNGLPHEAELLRQDLQSCNIPVIGVLGNHDIEGGKEQEVKDVFEEGNITILQGTSITIDDVGFAGVKGFGGGFDKYLLTPWGEPVIKEFVQVGINESLELEKALSRLSTKKKIVLMHYSPIADTVKGEAREIYPYLGCSRLVSPIKRFGADAVFHGHAHHGSAQGKTENDFPVYNVSIEVCKKLKTKKCYVIHDI